MKETTKTPGIPVEWNLSDKIKDNVLDDIGLCSVIPTYDVKEFIRKLKEYFSRDDFIKFIDELAGERL